MQQYEWRDFGLEPANRVMIHNQYLHYLVGSGIIGLFLWLLALLSPLAQPSLRKNPYVIHFLVVMGTGMLVDSLLELQIGFNLFVFLYSFLVVAGERRNQHTASNLPYANRYSTIRFLAGYPFLAIFGRNFLFP